MRNLPILPQSLPPAPVPPDAPQPWRHLIAGERPLVFVVDNSQLFEVGPELFDGLLDGKPEAEALLLDALVARGARAEDFAAVIEPTAVSLNIAQVCNLSCSYCYADEGLFGGGAKLMTEDVALRTIDRLVGRAGGRPVTVGFIGGEPLLNRPVLHASVRYARERGRQLGVPVRFSITTNASLLRADDIDLLRENAFAVSVSLDGGAAAHDRHRRTRGGAGSHAAAVEALGPLLRNPAAAKVAARATVTREDLRVVERVEALAAIGFQEVGVSPLRTGPDPALTLRDDDWPVFLAEMIRAAEVEQRRVLGGEYFRFSNFASALKEIHRGSCRPLPCGAAANYVSVSAEGDYYTCHRTVSDARFALGDAASGPSPGARLSFLRSRHVDGQQPCASCWARYLCGGGCHAEVVAAGRGGCDYVRGWLEYCLRAYNTILAERPALFDTGREH